MIADRQKDDREENCGGRSLIVGVTESEQQSMEFFARSYELIPSSNYWRELARPWKLASFAVGMGWLIFGALNYDIADWDVGVSLVMGGVTYVCAPWSVFIIGSALRFRPRHWWFHVLLALAVAVLVVDSSYLVYHGIVGNQTYRDANFQASLPLYFLAGTLWLYRGSLRSLIAGVRSAISNMR